MHVAVMAALASTGDDNEPRNKLRDAFPTDEKLEKPSVAVQAEADDSDEDVKMLKVENDRLQQENAALRKELDELRKHREGFQKRETEMVVRSDEVSDPVANEGMHPQQQRGAVCRQKQVTETGRGDLEQGKNSSGGSCAGARPQESNCRGSSFVSAGQSLGADAIRRYSRQLLVPAFGVAGQERLMKSSALVVGCGGLGSPIALYLAAAGVGCLGLVDHDVVEVSNLHRQVIHSEASVGEAKVRSAASACLKLNSSVQVVEYDNALNASNAVEIISKFDVVLDATDNLPTRYLLSDACVATGKALVSGAALGAEGQVTVYNHNNGPCYRCLFPIPPPQGARQRCSDNGVIGVVPGIIGSLQALEAVKLAAEVGETLSSRMLILDALSTRIHMVKLRGRNSACVACGDAPQILRSNLHQYDYERFTQSPLSDEAPSREHIIPDGDRISCEVLKTRLESGESHLLLDVREAHEYAISSLPNSTNIPYSDLKRQLHDFEKIIQGSRLENNAEADAAVSVRSPEDRPSSGFDRSASFSKASHGGKAASTVSTSASPSIYVVCRRGNDSQRAVQMLKDEGFHAVDVIGGLESWAKTIDREFPFY